MHGMYATHAGPRYNKILDLDVSSIQVVMAEREVYHTTRALGNAKALSRGLSLDLEINVH